MEGLRELRVKLLARPGQWGAMTAAQMAILVEPIMHVTTPELFELTVPFSRKGEDKRPWRSLPCRLIYLYESGV